jgi:phenylacetate-CoA ligase
MGTVSDVFDPGELQPPFQRAAMQEATLQKIAARALDTSPALKAALAAAALNPETLTLADLPRIPLLKKETLPRHQAAAPPFGEWLAKPLAEVRRIFLSPGPIYDPEGFAPDYWGFAPALTAAGFRRGDIVLNTFSYHFTPAGAMFDGALQILGCVVVPTGVGNIETQVKALVDLRARGFTGTPSFLAAVLDKVGERGDPSPLEVACVSGEMLPETLRHDLERRQRLRISQAYGIGDIGLVAYECAHRSGLHLAERVIGEIVDPATGAPVGLGETGEVVVTFLSDLYPLLRFATGDLSRLAASACPCGRTSLRLERILGRVGDAVKVRGIFLHPHDLDRAIARHPEVTRYQAVVTRADHRDELAVRVEAAGAASLAEAVAESIREATRLRATVDVVPPGTLESMEKRLVDRRTWE